YRAVEFYRICGDRTLPDINAGNVLLVLLISEPCLETVSVLTGITQTIVFGTTGGVSGDKQGFALLRGDSNALTVFQAWAGFGSVIRERWSVCFLSRLKGRFRFNHIAVCINDHLGGGRVHLVPFGVDEETA